MILMIMRTEMVTMMVLPKCPNALTKVAPLSSANEDVYGRPRHTEEAVRVAAVLREGLHDVFLPKIAARICQAIVQQNLQSII